MAVAMLSGSMGGVLLYAPQAAQAINGPVAKPTTGTTATGTATATTATTTTAATTGTLSYEDYMKQYIAAQHSNPKLKRTVGNRGGSHALAAVAGLVLPDDYDKIVAGKGDGKITDAKVFEAVYNDIYSNIGDPAGIDCNWSADVFGANALTLGPVAFSYSCGWDPNGLLINIAQAKAASKNENLNSTKDFIGKAAANISGINLNMALIYMEFKVLQASKYTPDADSTIKPDQDRYATDLDVAKNDKHIHKPYIEATTWTDVGKSVVRSPAELGNPFVTAYEVASSIGAITIHTTKDNNYGSMETFYQDFSYWQTFIDAQNAKLKNDSFNFADFDAGFDAANASMATSGNGNINAAGGQNNDASCGKAGYTDGITKLVQNALCGAVISFYTFSINLVASAANLYVVDSGIETDPSTAPSPGGADGTMFKSWIDTGHSSGLTTKFQDSMVSTNSNGYGSGVRGGYLAILSLLNGLLVLVFVLIALANILQIQVSNYAIKKVVPGLVIGFLMATSSWYMVRVLLEFSSVLPTAVFSASDLKGKNIGNLFTQNIINLEGTLLGNANIAPSSGLPVLIGGKSTTEIGGSGIMATSTDVDMGKLSIQLILDLAIFAAGALLFWLALLFILRNVVFAFLVPLAPLAFMGMTFEPLKSVWTRWWKFASGWLWMPTVSNFWIWMALTFFKVGNGSTGVGSLVMYVSAVVFLWAAVKTPFTMAGEANSMMNKLGKVANTATQKTGKFVGSAAKDTALRYTPAGMAVRAYNQISAQNKEAKNQLLQGSVVKGRLARTFGGDSINRAVSRRGLKLEQDKKIQDGMDAKVRSEAEEQLAVGSMRTAAARLDSMKSLPLIGDAAGKLAGKMNDAADKFNTEELFETNLRKLGGVGDLMANRVRRMTYAGRADEMEQTTLNTSRTTSRGKFALQKSFIEGRNSPDLKKKRSLDKVDDLAFKDATDDQIASQDRNAYMDIIVDYNNTAPERRTQVMKDQFQVAQRKYKEHIKEKANQVDSIYDTGLVGGAIGTSGFDKEIGNIETPPPPGSPQGTPPTVNMSPSQIAANMLNTNSIMNGTGTATQKHKDIARKSMHHLVSWHNTLTSANSTAKDMADAAQAIKGVMGGAADPALDVFITPTGSGIPSLDDQSSRQKAISIYKGTSDRPTIAAKLERMKSHPAEFLK